VVGGQSLNRFPPKFAMRIFRSIKFESALMVIFITLCFLSQTLTHSETKSVWDSHHSRDLCLYQSKILELWEFGRGLSTINWNVLWHMYATRAVWDIHLNLRSIMVLDLDLDFRDLNFTLKPNLCTWES